MTLTAEENDRLTRVGPGTPMGRLLRRYWHPIAAETELDGAPTKRIRVLGEDLVLYRDLRGTFGLIARSCPHRGMDLSFGMVEECGLRCPYHGWAFDERGTCLEQPFEATLRRRSDAAPKVRTTAYPVVLKAGLVWAYLGEGEPPLLPDWERYYDRGFKKIVLADIPCNWFQCQENAIDPVHFEWLHLNWTRYQNGIKERSSRHREIAFDEKDFGFVYRRLLEDSPADDDAWTIGRACVWPNCLYTGSFAWYVPIDDERTSLVMWTLLPLPGNKPFEQDKIPHFKVELFDRSTGEWLRTRFLNQDCLAWVGQGNVADRTNERLGLSDQGVIRMRRRFFDDLDALAAGRDPSAVLRAPAPNTRLPLPLMSDQIVPPPRLPPEMSHGCPKWLSDELARVWAEHSAT
jgi:5,5'-dehydrodivanillate O-demethylase oxygenase subunit